MNDTFQEYIKLLDVKRLIDILKASERLCDSNTVKLIVSELKTRKPPAKQLRLFVWTEFCPTTTPSNHGIARTIDGIAFAIAEDINQAKQMVVGAECEEPWDWGNLQEFPVNGPVAFSLSGGSSAFCQEGLPTDGVKEESSDCRPL